MSISEIKNEEGLLYLKSIKDNSIDLVLTDPPYIISKESGMNEHFNMIKENEKNNITEVKTEEQWEHYKKENGIKTDKNKENYIKYGTIYGSKYSVQTDFGEWDKNFTIEILDELWIQSISFPDYEASTQGRVRNFTNKRILKTKLYSKHR